MHHPMVIFFYKMAFEPLRGELKFCIAYGPSLVQLVVKKLTGLGQVTEL